MVWFNKNNLIRLYMWYVWQYTKVEYFSHKTIYNYCPFLKNLINCYKVFKSSLQTKKACQINLLQIELFLRWLIIVIICTGVFGQMHLWSHQYAKLHLFSSNQSLCIKLRRARWKLIWNMVHKKNQSSCFGRKDWR